MCHRLTTTEIEFIITSIKYVIDNEYIVDHIRDSLHGVVLHPDAIPTLIERIIAKHVSLSSSPVGIIAAVPLGQAISSKQLNDFHTNNRYSDMG
jgi:hypothetical protein